MFRITYENIFWQLQISRFRKIFDLRRYEKEGKKAEVKAGRCLAFLLDKRQNNRTIIHLLKLLMNIYSLMSGLNRFSPDDTSNCSLNGVRGRGSTSQMDLLQSSGSFRCFVSQVRPVSPVNHRWFAYSPFILQLHPPAGLFVHLYIHPSTLLINNDGGDESSTRGHFDLLGWHRNGCWPARASVRSLCSILPPSCCTMHTSPVFRHSASRPPVSRRLRNPPRGDYLHESFNLVSARLRQMSQETRGDTCER